MKIRIRRNQYESAAGYTHGDTVIEVKDLDGHAVAQGANDSADGTDD